MKRPLLGLTALALSCSTATVVNTTYNFDRATDVDFLCLQTGDGPSPRSAARDGLNRRQHLDQRHRDPSTGALGQPPPLRRGDPERAR